MKIAKSFLTRRTLLLSGLSTVLPGALSGGRFLFAESDDAVSNRLAEIEKKSGGRLGCAMLDIASGKQIAHRGDERFPMCSTFKFLAAAFVLHRVEQGQEHLDRRVVFSRKDLVHYSPLTEKQVDGKGMTIAELCAAVMIFSDNTAANLLLASFGGPPALTAFLRTTGDSITRLDRTEPTLNEAIPGDPRDTTTPVAMLQNLSRLLLGNILNLALRQMLTDWMIACQTGKTKLRAGLPSDWKAGDKTGSGNNGTNNDIAIFWPPHRAPILITAYLTGSNLPDQEQNAIVADVGRAFSDVLQPA
jgi:beta-lactamase class A